MHLPTFCISWTLNLVSFINIDYTAYKFVSVTFSSIFSDLLPKELFIISSFYVLHFVWGMCIAILSFYDMEFFFFLISFLSPLLIVLDEYKIFWSLIYLSVAVIGCILHVTFVFWGSFTSRLVFIVPPLVPTVFNVCLSFSFWRFM